MSKFYVGLVTLIGVGLWASPASAVLNVYEPFDYSTGSLQGKTLPNTPAIYGTAANQAWVRAGVQDFPSGINVTSGNLSGPSALPPSVGNDVSFTPPLSANNGASIRLPLGQNYTNGSTVYYSFLLNVTDLSSSNNTIGAFFFSFNNTQSGSQTNNPGVQPGKLQLRIDPTDATKYNLGVFSNEGATAGSTAWATNQLDPNVPLFIVGSQSVSNVASSVREAKLWINPDASQFGLGTAPTFTAHDTADTSGWSGNNIGSILVRQNTALASLTMDELRVANTWAEVTPTLQLYWDTNGTTAGSGATPSGNWDSTANWNPSATGDAATQAWGGGSYTAVFTAGDSTTGGATGPYTVTVSGTQSALNLAFEDGTPTLTGGTVNVVGGKITTNTGVIATVGSVIGGSAGMNKVGSGTLNLTGNATYSGSTTIAAGTLGVGDGTTSGSLPAASVITNNGAVIFNRSDTVTQGTNFDSTGAGMSGTGSLTQSGSGNLVLPVANTYSGQTSATAGTLTFKHTLAAQNSVVVTDAGGAVVFDPTLAGQNVTVGGLSSASTAYTAPPSNNMSLTINAVSGNASYAPAIGGTGTMTKKGTFAQTLSGTNTFNGATSIDVGTLQYAQKTSMPAGSAITVNGKSDWTVTAGTSTNFTGGILSVYTDDGTSGTTWSNSTASSAGTIGGLINGIGGQGNSITWKNGSSLGVHVEPGLGDPTAGIVYSGVIGNFKTVVTLAGDFNNDNTVNAADFTTYRKIDNTTSGYFDFRSTFGLTGGGPGTTNNVGFMKRGSGTLTLSAANTFSGQLKVNDDGGTLRLTAVQANAGQSMALPAVYIGGATASPNTILKILTNDAIPSNSLIRFGNGTTGAGEARAILRLHEADPPNTSIASIPAQSFNQTVRGLSGGNGRVQIGAGTLTINTPGTESYSYTGKYQTDYDAAAGASGQHGTIIKTGTGRQDFDFTDTENGGSILGTIKGEFILQQGTVGMGTNQIFGLNPQVIDPNTSNALPWPRLTINGGTLMNTSGSSLSISVPNLFIGGSFTFDVVTGNNSQFSGGTNHTLTTLTASPTITVTAGTGGAFILPYKVQDDGTPRGITKAGPGILTLGGELNSYRGDTTIQEGILRLSTGVIAAGTVPVLGNQTTPGRLVFAGGRLEMNGQLGTTWAPEYVGGPYHNTRTNIESNPIHVEAPNDNSTIAYFSTTTGVTDDVNFVFTSNSVDWTSGALTFVHSGTSQGATYRPTFTGSGFTYAGPVAISNGGGTRKTVLQSANTSGTQTWAGAMSGDGQLRRQVDGGETDLTGANTFTGGAIVDGGILAVSGSNATFGGGNLTVNAGHAAIAAGVLNAIANTATLTLLGGGAAATPDIGYIDLAAGVNEQVVSLVLGSTPFTSGTFGATGSGAANINDEYFSGLGMITVAPASGSSLDSAAVPEPAALSIMMFAIGSALATSRSVFRRRKS